MIATNVPLFHALNEMPIVLDPARLDEGGGIEETLRRNKAQYHQSCGYLFNNTKLDRARKRAAPQTPQSEEGQTKLRRSSSEGQGSKCFLCDEEEPASDLRHAMTMQLNKRLSDCAKTLNDERLLKVLSGGDVIAQELKYHSACLATLYNRERAFLRNVKKMK